MKITIPTTTFFSEETVNGITNTVMLISRQLMKMGHDINVIAPLQHNLPEEENIGGIKVKRIPTSFDFKYSRKLVSEIKNFMPDLVHSFHYGYYPATAGFNASFSMKIPHIFTTSYHDSRTSVLSSIMIEIYGKIQGKKLLSQSSRVLPQNMNEAQGLQKITPEMKYNIVPCPINSKFFRPKRKKSKRKLVAYVGTMLPWKGAGTAFDICKKIEQQREDVDFVFIGPGYLKPEMMKKSSERFTFKENISIEQLANWYNKADVMLYPTQYESFGRVLAEAMACGTPIVSTKVGAVPETVGSGGMLVDYGDWKTMEKNVLEILDNRKLCKRLGLLAIKHSKQYDYAAVGKTVEGIYQEVLNEN